MQIEISDSCLQGAQRSCAYSSDGKGCQCHTAESSPFQLLAQSVIFSVMVSFIVSVPVVFTSWTGNQVLCHTTSTSTTRRKL